VAAHLGGHFCPLRSPGRGATSPEPGEFGNGPDADHPIASPIGIWGSDQRVLRTDFGAVAATAIASSPPHGNSAPRALSSVGYRASASQTIPVLRELVQSCGAPGACREIDILAEHERSLVAIEVKAAATLDSADLKNIRWFKAEGPGKTWQVIGIVFYLGDHALSFRDNVFGMPLSMFWAWSRPSQPFIAT